MMYRHGWQWRRLYVALDRGLDFRGWLCAIFRLHLAMWAPGNTLHAELMVGPLMLDLKVL